MIDGEMTPGLLTQYFLYTIYCAVGFGTMAALYGDFMKVLFSFILLFHFSSLFFFFFYLILFHFISFNLFLFIPPLPFPNHPSPPSPLFFFFFFQKGSWSEPTPLSTHGSGP